VRGIDDLCAWGGLLEHGGEAIGAGEEEIVFVCLSGLEWALYVCERGAVGRESILRS